MLHEALLYQSWDKQQVKCLTCNHYCIIDLNKTGICATKKNIKGKLFSLTYNLAIAEQVDPIEKKPFFHFLPGSLAYSFAAAGCNFRCSFCQNWQISQQIKEYGIEGYKLPPEQIIARAVENHCQSIAYTYTEPTIFLEYALATMILAKINKLKNVWVSNGYMSDETIEIILPYLDAINIDLKSFSPDFYLKICGAQIKPVLKNIKIFKQNNILVELTTLLIPGKNDSLKELKEIVNFIVTEIGPETPWHISQFHPDYQMDNITATDLSILEQAYDLGKKVGLHNVYLGNVITANKENTYCPKCHELFIQRQGYVVIRFDQQGQCSNCHHKFYGYY